MVLDEGCVGHVSVGQVCDGRERPAARPAVSVVIPVFNGAHQVDHALQSVLTQGFTDFEVVIVDDGSTDDTADVLARWAAYDSRVVVVVHSDNAGIVAALESGRQRARGALIARLDADDVCLPGRLAAQVQVFRAHPSTVLVWSAYERVELTETARTTVIPPLTHAEMQFALVFGNRIAHSSVMFSAAAASRVGGYRTEWFPAEDYDLWCRLLADGPGRGLSTALAAVTVNPVGISASDPDGQATMARLRATAERQRYEIDLLRRDRPGGRPEHLRRIRRVAVAVRRDLRSRGLAARSLDRELVPTLLRVRRDDTRARRWVSVTLMAPIASARCAAGAILGRGRGARR